MNFVDDVPRLAKALLQGKLLDQQGYETVGARFAESQKLDPKYKSKASPGKKGLSRDNESQGGLAIRFIAGLKLKQPQKPTLLLTEDDISRVVARHFSIPFEKLDPMELNIDLVTSILPKAFALKHMVLPLHDSGGVVEVAICDPEIQDALDGVTRATGKRLEVVMTAPGDLAKIIHELYGFRSSVKNAAEKMAPSIDLGNLEQLSKVKRPDQIESNDEHITNAVDYLFNYAFEMRASDIHLEPKREATGVRFRIDGALQKVYSIPRGVHQAMASRIKMLARMNIAEKRRPQDGRIRLDFGGSSSEIRVSSMATAFGEKLVMRLLKPEALIIDLESLGFFSEDLIRFERALSKPYGIFLVTGPTGSGKTTTMYSALSTLASPDKNIITVEDPIETIIEDFNQVGVQPSIGVTFATSLRTILRQDPDIIMIGEIRDPETAENAVQAALTGHFVLSTLHTNDTTSSLMRLLDLGVQPFLLSSSLVGILAQRLVRSVCSNCAKDVVYPVEKLAMYGIKSKEKELTLKEGAGCDYCRQTGYYGRTVVYEILEIDETMRKLIQTNAMPGVLREQALRSGMGTLRENALRKAIRGETTLREALRVSFGL
ncbi:MAG: GspE/PulE family protein [Nitrospinota bacterium]|nr:GspE/PulE family protein [Nitrospinota bacterium]MDH5756226.1 GspE/PulE family protein [Nitrospinota bacterium]